MTDTDTDAVSDGAGLSSRKHGVCAGLRPMQGLSAIGLLDDRVPFCGFAESCSLCLLDAIPRRSCI